MHRHGVRDDRLLKRTAPDRLTPTGPLPARKILKDPDDLGPTGPVLGDEAAIPSLHPRDLQVGANEADPHHLRRCCESGSQGRFKHLRVLYIELPTFD
jgi:hypothetical protein